MKNIPLIIGHIILMVYSASAQTADARCEFTIEGPYQHTIQLNSGFYSASNALTNRLISDYYYHRFISNQTKDDVSSKISPQNIFGVAFQGNLSYIYKPSTSLSRFIFTVNHRLYDECQFHKDVFDLYFRGNKRFAGQTASLDNSRFRSMLYYQIGFGIGQGTTEDRLTWFAIGSLCIGDEFLDINSSKGSLYTSQEGDYIDANLNISIHKSDSAKTGPFNVNGKGFAINAGMTYLLGENTKLHTLFHDIGFMRFNEQSSSVRIDTTTRFEGIDANSLFSFTDSFTLVRNDSDYIQQFISDRKKTNYNRWLPGNFDVWIEKNLPGETWNVAIGLRNYIQTFARPLGWMEISRKLNRKNTIRLHTQYGGYAGWNAGLGYQFTSGSWSARISSDFISSWLNPVSGSSMGAFVSLSKSF
jgi:hypothetical protein